MCLNYNIKLKSVDSLQSAGDDSAEYTHRGEVQQSLIQIECDKGMKLATARHVAGQIKKKKGGALVTCLKRNHGTCGTREPGCCMHMP